MAARLDFTNDATEYPITYHLDMIAGNLIDSRRAHPEAEITFDMPARDRVQAVALLRLALSALGDDG